MIVPLLSGSGMRVKIIEGMALGKTIITSSIGTEGINTSHGKNILIANTADEFINELEKIINNQDLHRNISIKAIEFINENFNKNNIAKNLISFYNQQNNSL